MDIALIGFGEAAQAFTEGWGSARLGRCSAFDIKTDAAGTAAAKRSDYARYAVQGADTLEEAMSGAELILSLVTADQALAVASRAAQSISGDALFCDMNSVAPDTKSAAAAAIGAAGGRYVDVAVMAPVRPALLAVPLLVSGAHAEVAVSMLRGAGFQPRRVIGDVGTASAIKMIRSIMIKGIEALTAECLLSAQAAGVENEVIALLDASFPDFDWRERAAYNLDRMLVHGARRAAEMREAADTAKALGQLGLMAHATAEWQDRLGALALPRVPQGFEETAQAILQATGTTAR